MTAGSPAGKAEVDLIQTWRFLKVEHVSMAPAAHLKFIYRIEYLAHFLEF